VRVSEWIVFAYLAYLLALAAVRPMPRGRRTRVVSTALPVMALIVVTASLPSTPAWGMLRTWLPVPYVLIGYWLSGVFFVSPQPDVEARFLAFDRRVRRSIGLDDAAIPRVVLELLELAYLACYIVLPAGLLALLLAGQGPHADRFWSTVLLAELACYGTLPWVQTRPGWALRPQGAVDDRRLLVRRVNLFFVRSASIRANTFPSGHAAGALATALAVAQASPASGAGFLLLAAGIAAGSVVGEYHYAGDAIAGAGVALVAWGVVWVAGI
jgi:membrane-associated phospholipid phosphatase